MAVVVNVIGQFDGKEIDRAQRELDKLGNKTKENEGKVKSMGRQFNVAAGVVAAAVGGQMVRSAIDFGLKMQDMNLQAEQTERKFSTVFGDMADDMREWVDEQNEAFGVSEEGLMGLASSVQDILVPLGFARDEASGMTSDILQLGNALSEFNPGTTAGQAIGALTSALTGEREQMKQFGIVISEADVQARLLAKGLQGLEGDALKQAKAQATLELALEGSGDAMDAYSRRAGTATAETKALQAAAEDAEQSLAEAFAPEVAFAREELGLIADSLADASGALAQNREEVSFLEAAYEFILGDGAARAVEDWYDAHRLWNREAGVSAIRMREIGDELEAFGPGSDAFAEAMRQNVQEPLVDVQDEAGATGDAVTEMSTAVEDRMAELAEAAEKDIQEIASDLGGMADAFAGAEDEIEITMDEMIANVEEDLAQQQEFVGGLEQLYRMGMDDVADMFRSQGPAAVGAMREFLASPLEEQMKLEGALENAREFGEKAGPETVAAAERAQGATAARWKAIGEAWAKNAEGGWYDWDWNLNAPTPPSRPGGGGGTTPPRRSGGGGGIRVLHDGGYYEAPGGAREGWAWLETGEYVTPKGGGPGVTINVHNPQTNDLNSDVSKAMTAVRLLGVV